MKRIEINPRKLGGKPVIKGTRIAVEQILRMLGRGVTIEDILADFPHLKKEDISVALVYGEKDYTRLRKKMFLRETVDTLYKKIKKIEKK